MIGQSLPSERLALVGVLDPNLTNNAVRSTAWISMAEYPYLLGTFNIGATDTTAVVSVQQADDATGTNPTTLKTAASRSATDDNKQVMVNVRERELTQGKTHVRFQVTIGNGATGANVAGIVQGFDKRYGQEGLANVASLAEIVR